MTATDTQRRIIIIGGGLAGLSLGQGLKQANIPFLIFERDANADYRPQGYRIRISPEGAEALRRLLPEPLWYAFESTCAEVVHGGAQLNALTGEKTTRPVPGPPPHLARPAVGQNGPMTPTGKSYNADREVLRSVLLAGLEDYVSFGKKFERYEITEDGVSAHFTDSTTEKGSFLVGADGVRSVVRRHFLPNMTVLDTEGRAVFGKSTITDEMVSQMPKEIGHGMVLASEKADSTMKLFSDGMSFARESCGAIEEQLGLRVPRDYIYWVLLFRKDVVGLEEEQSLLMLSTEQSAQLSLDLTKDWHSSLRAVLQHQTVEAASTLAFFTSSPDFVSEWKARPEDAKGRVTLVGDSAHPMPPVGGVGANAGFQDAADLLEALMQSTISECRHQCATFDDPSDGFIERGCCREATNHREQLISAYEDKMLARSKTLVDRSTGGGSHFFGMKPVAELKPASMWHKFA